MSDDEEQHETAGDAADGSGTEATQEPTGEHPGAGGAEGEAGPEPEAGAAASGEGRAGRVTGSAAPGSQAEFEDALRGVIAELPPEKRNKWIPGTLRVHYRTRDVDFSMDGESALRLLAVVAGTSNDMDSVRRSSDAQRLWLVVDRSEVLGAQWIPDELCVPVAVTMDPGGLVDAAR